MIRFLNAAAGLAMLVLPAASALASEGTFQAGTHAAGFNGYPARTAPYAVQFNSWNGDKVVGRPAMGFDGQPASGAALSINLNKGGDGGAG